MKDPTERLNRLENKNYELYFTINIYTKQQKKHPINVFLVSLLKLRYQKYKFVVIYENCCFWCRCLFFAIPFVFKITPKEWTPYFEGHQIC